MLNWYENMHQWLPSRKTSFFAYGFSGKFNPTLGRVKMQKEIDNIEKTLVIHNERLTFLERAIWVLMGFSMAHLPTLAKVLL